MSEKHISVLLQESIQGLNIKPEGIYIDATLGRAGHSREIVRRLTIGHLYSIDKDQTAIDACRIYQQALASRWTLIKGDYQNLDKLIPETAVDGILLDIGVSSPQFDEPERGFSYRFDARLDMRMDQSQSLSAYEVVNTYDQQQLQEIFWLYGEESFARPIAQKIVKQRMQQPIETTLQLVAVIKSALPNKILNKKGHPAKKVFQAIRIEVNNELDGLKQGIEKSLQMLKPQGRLAIITFHSLEDRIVKKAFDAVTTVKTDKRIPLREKELPQAAYQLVNRKPITASEIELSTNLRAHSAKLRIIEKK